MKRFVVFLMFGLQALAYDASAAAAMDLTIASDMAAVDVYQMHQARGSLWGLGLSRNEDMSATTASINFNVVGDLAAAKSVKAGVGWKALYLNTYQSAFSLAVGGAFRFEPAGVAGLGFEGQAYMAPDVLTTNDADRYHELVARVTYDLHSRATVFAGWANRTVRYQEGAPVRRVEIADGLMAGFSLAF